jgi:hypothetical protein
MAGLSPIPDELGNQGDGWNEYNNSFSLHDLRHSHTDPGLSSTAGHDSLTTVVTFESSNAGFDCVFLVWSVFALHKFTSWFRFLAVMM